MYICLSNWSFLGSAFMLTVMSSYLTSFSMRHVSILETDADMGWPGGLYTFTWVAIGAIPILLSYTLCKVNDLNLSVVYVRVVLSDSAIFKGGLESHLNLCFTWARVCSLGPQCLVTKDTRTTYIYYWEKQRWWFLRTDEAFSCSVYLCALFPYLFAL